MVHDSVWKLAGMGPGMLCIGCLEVGSAGSWSRTTSPMYYAMAPHCPWHTARLRNRLTGTLDRFESSLVSELSDRLASFLNAEIKRAQTAANNGATI